MNEPMTIHAPFRRGASDIATAQGRDLTEAAIRQIVATTPGELPWRTSFGAGTGRLRHRPMTAVLPALARIWSRDAVRSWLPGVEITAADAVIDGTAISVVLTYSAPGAGNVVAVEL